MSLRPPVNHDRLVQFLRVPRGTRLYLQGGALAILAGTRDATIDVDYDVRIPPGSHGRWEAALRAVCERLQINAEPEGPAGFVPLPAGWEERCRFTARYGAMDVYTMDPYATALAKLARGTRVDLEDVRDLIEAGLVRTDRLLAMGQEIAARWDERQAGQSAEQFVIKVRAFLDAIGTKSSTQAPPP